MSYKFVYTIGVEPLAEINPLLKSLVRFLRSGCDEIEIRFFCTYHPGDRNGKWADDDYIDLVSVVIPGTLLSEREQVNLYEHFHDHILEMDDGWLFDDTSIVDLKELKNRKRGISYDQNERESD